MHKKFITSILAILTGLFFAINSLKYSLGATSNMGPGYYPLVVSCIIIAIGVVLLMRTMHELR